MTATTPETADTVIVTEEPTPITEEIGGAADALASWAGADWQNVLILAGIAAGAYLVLRVIQSVLANLLARGKPEGHTLRHGLGKLIGRTNSLFLIVLAVAAVLQFSEAPDEVQALAAKVFMIALILQAAVWATAFISSIISARAQQSEADGSTLRNAVTILNVLTGVLVWAIAVLLVVDNVGFEVAPLIAGLGVGGIAIGLAAQGIFSDLFAALSIIFDKPFNRGDFIIFGGDMGTVEKIGLRSTHLRTLSGQLLVVSNTELLSSRINNYKRMAERRIVFQVGVTYQCPRDVLRQLPGLLKDSVLARGEDKVRFDRAHFMAYGDSSLNLEVVYYVLSPEYGVYMDIHQAILLDIHEKFEAVGAEFAYPSRTLFLSAPNGDAVDPRELGMWGGKDDASGLKPDGTPVSEPAGG